MPSPAFEHLRRRIAALEGAVVEGAGGTASLGPLDRFLPWCGLRLGALHEISPASPGPLRDGAALGFAAGMLGRLTMQCGKPVLWLAETAPPHAPGLAAFGLNPARLVVALPGRAAATLWALEEAARSTALAAVLAEVRGMEPIAARRLHLAARTSGTTVVLLNRAAAISAAETRWRVGGLASADAPRWRVDLVRCRGRSPDDGGVVVRWEVEWDETARGFRLVAEAGHRPAMPQDTRVA